MGTLLNTEDAFDGYTLFGNNEVTYLIDNCGDVINSWMSEYKTGHGMYLLENGDLIRAGNVEGSFDAGGRGGIIEIFAWDGHRKWFFFLADKDRHAHHDLAVLPNGNILATLWERKSEDVARAAGRIFGGEIWSERIIEIHPVGSEQADIVWQWTIWDHLIQESDPALSNYGRVEEHPELLDINFLDQGRDSTGSWLHVNAIDYHPDFDQIVISARNHGEIYVIDHSTSSEEASGHSGGKYGKGGDLLYRYGNPRAYGKGSFADRRLHGQHDIRWIPHGVVHGGNFMVFNNEWIEGQQSRVQVFRSPALANGSYIYNALDGFGPDTLIRTITWDGMHSDILSGSQTLPNGNVLITLGRDGHFIEVDEDDEVVWEYINPVNRNGGPGIQGGDPRFNVVFRAARYAPDFPGFEGRPLAPGEPIELSPFGDCVLYPVVTTSTVDVENASMSSVYPNPFDEFVIINTPRQSWQGSLYDLTGRKLAILEGHSSGIHKFSMPNLPTGVYCLVLHSYGRKDQVLKLVKTQKL